MVTEVRFAWSSALDHQYAGHGIGAANLCPRGHTNHSPTTDHDRRNPQTRPNPTAISAGLTVEEEAVLPFLLAARTEAIATLRPVGR